MTKPTAEQERAAFRKIAEENLALRCLLGGGCDANNDGSHRVMKQPKGYEFCIDCGETTRNGKTKPWFSEDRLKRIIERGEHHKGKD